MAKISIIGSGHWGLALASVLASNNNEVLMYARDLKKVDEFNNKHTSVYIKDYVFSNNIKSSNNIEEVFNFSNIILISLPVVAIYDTLSNYVKRFKDKIYLFTSKGLFNGNSMSSIFKSIDSNLKLAVLSGPSFSKEVIEKKNTAVVIASNDIEIATNLQKLFSNEYFRVYTSTDVIGVEYCGAIKNIFAIICGMVDGADMGSNTKNAIITRGLAEMKRIIKYVGGNLDTLYGLAGIGDIMLTCNSFESRNYSYGYSYTSNKENNSSGVVEGLNTIKEIHVISNKNNLSMPITNSLYEVLINHKDIVCIAKKLMTRDLKSE